MKIHEHSKIIELGNAGQFKIIAFGDVHYGAKACHLKRFEKNVLARNADNPNAYFLCMGDALDLIGPKDPRFRPDEGMGFEDFVDAQIDGFVALFKKHKIPPHRILGMGLGNHEDSIRKFYGTDPVHRMCKALETEHLGYCFALRLKTRVNGACKYPISIMGHHGFAGGRKEGAAVNAYTDWMHRHPGHNIYLFGHNHKKWFHKVPVVEIDFNKREQVDRSVLVGNTGTYLRTYSKGVVPTYSEKKGFYPVELGHLEIELTHTRESEGSGKTRKQRSWLEIRGVE